MYKTTLFFFILVEEEIDPKKRRIVREKYDMARKPVYVMSDLYKDFSSEEEDLNHNDRVIGKETNFDFLDAISLDDFPDVDEDFVSNIVGYTDFSMFRFSSRITVQKKIMQWTIKLVMRTLDP